MSVELEKKYEPHTDFRNVEGAHHGKKMLAAEEKLVQAFNKDGDSVKLRKSFYGIRKEYLEGCLTAYAKDFGDMNMPANMMVELLAIKLGSHVKRFDRDLNLLFKGTSWRNRLAISRFTKAGTKAITQVIERT